MMADKIETPDDDETDAATPPLTPAVPEDDGFDDHDLSLLTDDERDALLAKDDEDDPEDEEDGDDAGDAEEPAPGETPAADEPADDDAAPEPEAPPVTAKAEPVPDTAPMHDAIKALEVERDALIEKFEDGDLTRDAYKAALADLSKREREVVGNIARVEAQQEAIRTAFYGEVQSYAKAYPELLDPAGPHVHAYDRHVRAVTSSPDYEHLTHRQMLEAAHRLYVAEAEVLGRAHVPMKAAPKPKADPAPAAEAPKTKAEKPKREIVPTLAKAPAAAAVTVNEGKYAALQQRLDAAQTAEEVERLMASLSPEEAEAFASMDA